MTQHSIKNLAVHRRPKIKMSKFKTPKITAHWTTQCSVENGSVP